MESPDFQLTAERDWGWNPNLPPGARGLPVDDSDSDITVLMWNGVGGGTVVYAAQWQRNMPSDFRVRTLDGVGDDWPLTYEDLEPFYVARRARASASPGSPATPPIRRAKGPPLPPVPLASMGRRVARAHNELGWHWWPAPIAIASRRYGSLAPCVQRATCLQACADGAKASVDRTHWPSNIELGVDLITRATVQRIVMRDDGLAAGAVYADADGREHEVRAGVTIVAANGIGTPRLLLLSADARHPDGLANSSGLVGTRLMMHPFGTVVGLFDDDLRSWQGVWGQHLHSLEFYETDESRGFVRGAKWGLQPTGGPFSDDARYPWGAENEILGEGFHEALRKRFGRSAMWGIIAEDLPEEHNRVVLDPVAKDERRHPGPKILYRMSENSHRLLAFHQARAEESLEAAGAYETHGRAVHPCHRLASAGHRDDGNGPGDLGRGPLGPHARRAEPVHFRRQRVADVSRHEPHGDDRRDGAALRGASRGDTPRSAGRGMTE